MLAHSYLCCNDPDYLERTGIRWIEIQNVPAYDFRGCQISPYKILLSFPNCLHNHLFVVSVHCSLL
jgi:hypothetical protein